LPFTEALYDNAKTSLDFLSHHFAQPERVSAVPRERFRKTTAPFAIHRGEFRRSENTDVGPPNTFWDAVRSRRDSHDPLPQAPETPRTFPRAFWRHRSIREFHGAGFWKPEQPHLGRQIDPKPLERKLEGRRQSTEDGDQTSEVRRNN
jgi:hypothetical protein